jgi:hypothetical protein
MLSIGAAAAGSGLQDRGGRVQGAGNRRKMAEDR